MATDDSWYVYIVSCSDGSLYTGTTNDLERRIYQHNASKAGARYTRSRRPVELVYYETVDDRSEACRKEYKIRKLPAMDKIGLIVGQYEQNKSAAMKPSLSSQKVEELEKRLVKTAGS